MIERSRVAELLEEQRFMEKQKAVEYEAETLWIQQQVVVLYQKLFWSWYPGLGSQTQTSKLSKVLISGVSFCNCSLSQSHESNVLSYPECKIAENFSGFCPLTPLGRTYSTQPPPPRDSPAAQRFFPLLCSSKNQHPQKTTEYSTEWQKLRLVPRFWRSSMRKVKRNY